MEFNEQPKNEDMQHDSKKDVYILHRTIKYYYVWFCSLIIPVGISSVLHYVSNRNAWVLYLSVFFLTIPLSIITFVSTRLLLQRKMKNIPVHKEHVQVLKKIRIIRNHGNLTYDLIIKLPDDSKETIHIIPQLICPNKKINSIVKNNTGMVLYEKKNNKKKFFLGFERDDGLKFYSKNYYEYVISPNKK